MKRLYFFIFFITTILKTLAAPTNISTLIKVDQFGYRLNDQKISVISIPQTGYNAPSSFSPGTIYQVRNWFTDAVVFSGNLIAWNNGDTHIQSGDKAYWFNFTQLAIQGSFYIFDPVNNVGSYRFEINDMVYNNVLKSAVRMFYYQRCGAPKLPLYAQSKWSDGACHIGSNQDTDCRLYNNTNLSTSRDLSGGWHDAGDYNKYVNFAYLPMINLLLAYEESPTIWRDDFGIPESGNGIPDLLDEVKYELDWLLKMQNPDGSLLSIVGATSYSDSSPPSSHSAPRRYGPPTTSATFSGAAIFALAAIQFNKIGQAAYALRLKNAAIYAYNWAAANPGNVFNNSGIIVAGNQEISAYGVSSRQLEAAIYLYALTNMVSYKSFVDVNYSSLHLISWSYAYPFETTQQDALLYYAFLPSATTSVASNIVNTYTQSMKIGNFDNLTAFVSNADPYRSYLKNNNWTWGSNQTKGCQGNMFASMNYYRLDNLNDANYKDAAAGFVHYFHGVNPNGKVFLSNMGGDGAENSVSSMYHAWFCDGNPLWDEVGVSLYGPPPGFIPVGPNPNYTLDTCCPNNCGAVENNALCSTNVTPPFNQPIQKSYKDFNNTWPINSWVITEPTIYNNAVYVRLLSKFFGDNTLGLDEDINELDNVLLYPSPAKNEVNISFVSVNENIFDLTILDMLGKTIVKKKINLIDNNKIVPVNISGLPSGIYFFRIDSAENHVVKKIIKE